MSNSSKENWDADVKRFAGKDRGISAMSSENSITPYKKGDFIGKRYEVYDALGMGGFGIVYLVYSLETESV